MHNLPQLVPLSNTPVIFVSTLTPYEAGQLDARENVPSMQFRFYLCFEDEIAYRMGFEDALAALIDETSSKPNLGTEDSAGLMDYDAIEDDHDWIRAGC